VLGSPQVTSRAILCVLALVALACSGRSCGGLDGKPPPLPPTVTGPDGREYYLLDRGAYKAFYDPWGRLQRIEYDSNGDGKPDHIAHHDGEKSPHLLEVDEDFDSRTDRWEEYDARGQLTRVGMSRRGGAAPDLWIVPGPDGLTPARKEYDDDGDGRPERVEILSAGVVTRIEMDADRDGRPDRWRTLAGGRLTMEELDTDADGKPDRRIRFDDKGRVVGLERIVP
jgi:hypothetical protein